MYTSCVSCNLLLQQLYLPGLLSVRMLCANLAVDERPYDTVIGVLSYDAPLAAALRDAIRATWLASPPDGVLARFVLRTGGQKAYAEGTAHNDTVFLSSAGVRPRAMAHIDRASGPLRSVLGWYKCALARWPNAETIGKAEDDVYAHLTDVHRYLRTALAQSPRPSRLYWGSFETFVRCFICPACTCDPM